MMRDSIKKVAPSVTNDVFLDFLINAYEEARRILPPLQYIGFNEHGELHLLDRSTNTVITIRLKDRVMLCEFCNSEKCLHIGFAMSADEVKLAIATGMVKKVRAFSV